MILENLITNAPEYEYVRITRENIGRYLSDIYELEESDPDYNKICGYHSRTKDEVKEDVLSLPKQFSEKQKFFLCLYKQGELIAVLDYLEQYRYKKEENQTCTWVGLLQVSKNLQHQGHGQQIMDEFERSAAEDGFDRIQLGVIQGNRGAERFWEKEGFQKIADYQNGKWLLSVLEKEIS